MCVICMHSFNTNAIISATRYQIEIKLLFRNDNMFDSKVLSISFDFKELLLKNDACNAVYHMQPDKT